MLNNIYFKAPFTYFGGKAMIASVVWKCLGQPDHYIEPCFGSGAVLLARPGWFPEMTETVNDKDGFVANVWRSIQFSPAETAKVCDWPVNHADLIARKARLIREENYLLENLCKDDKWHDVELAGYWIWAASCWIGSGLTCPGQRPHLGDNKGAGVHAVGKRPHLSNKGIGVHAIGRIPHLADKGKGVHAIGQIPHLSTKGAGIHASADDGGIYDWFAALSHRLRYVRVVCGDWSRVCGGNWQSDNNHWKNVGIFFDPPYASEDRNLDLYHHDGTNVSREIGAWCLERGARPEYRIVIAGYENEYPALLDASWQTYQWKTRGGYGNIARSGVTRGQTNRHREMLYVSPYCENEVQGILPFE